MANNSWSGLTEKQDKIWEEWTEQYVPLLGKADTIGGEIIRAVDRIIYRFYNDGDMAGVGYGNVTCNGSNRFLLYVLPEGIWEDLDGISDETAYENKMLINHRRVFRFMSEEGSNLFAATNFNFDSRERTQEDFDREREEEEYEYGDEEEY